MKRKITLLIVASVTGLIALCLVQMYLIRNSYELKKEAFLTSTREAVSSIDDSFTRVDSLRSQWRDNLVEITTTYTRGEITREMILEQFGAKTHEMNPVFQEIVKEELDQLGLTTSLKFQKRVQSIVMQNLAATDTIYSITKNEDSFILGDIIDGVEYQLGGSTSFSESTSSTEEDGREVLEINRLHFQTETVMSIEGWEQQILLKMKGLLIISICIFLFVFGVLFYSIKTLITQKKITDIKTDFINNISHEFKTPLTTLSLATGMLRKELAQNDKSGDTIAVVERQNQKLQKLLDQVMTNSLSYNEIQLDLENINAATFLNELLDDFELSMQEVGITLIRNLKSGNQSIVIDPFYLATAIVNILENAAKYNREEVTIHFGTRVNDSFCIEVKDNGIGISDKDQQNLFEKFYRVVKDDTHDVKGLGLGLYYANQIVKAHGGKMLVSSERGVGSIFTIELPLN